jgi:cellulose biosynthesis protein BcsQ
MDLSPEDALRLNVLLASAVEAIRIDESSMTLYALSKQGEAKVALNPNCRDEPYLRRVREALSSNVLGSPGGYPVYLKRWTRMGQTRDGSLESLLLLGEPEAVVAVVNAAGLTDELARRAWWANPTADNARCMLERDSVAKGTMGPTLAAYLVDYLPFEQDAGAIIDTVRLVLKAGLLDEQTRLEIWSKGKHRNTYYVGFLLAIPDDLPELVPVHQTWSGAARSLSDLVSSGNRFAIQLLRMLDSPGQSFLNTAEVVIRRPANQEVVTSVLNAIAAYLQPVRCCRRGVVDMEQIVRSAEDICNRGADHDEDLYLLLETVPELTRLIRAMVALSMVDENLVNPVFSRTDAIGSLMRRKLEPVVNPILRQIADLRA